MERIRDYFDEVSAALSALSLAEIRQAVSLLTDAYLQRRQVFIMGNGGSAATASHFACDLAKSTAGVDGQGLKVISLTDNAPMITAWANDTDYSNIFAAQLSSLVEERDLVIAISGSGNSGNVLNGVRLARRYGAITLGLTGFDGGQLKDLVDLCLIVPSNRMTLIEDVHLILEHTMSSRLGEVALENGFSRPRRSYQRKSSRPRKELERVPLSSWGT